MDCHLDRMRPLYSHYNICVLSTRPEQARWILAAGDSVALLAVTVIGFRGHGTLETAGWRFPATLLPLLIAWYIVAPLLNLFSLKVGSDARQLWRLPWAMLLAAPLASSLRGMLLNAEIAWIFVLVTAATGSLALLIWRVLFPLVFSWSGAADG